MDDVISRRAALKALKKNRFPGAHYIDIGIKIALREIKALPSAQPEIVMCKDCKKYIDYRCRDEHANLSDWRHKDDYCCYAERREVSE